MAIDRTGVLPEIRERLEYEDTLPPATTEQLSVEGRRAAMRRDAPLAWGAKEDVHSIEDVVIPTADAALRARISRPRISHGTFLYLHGGGWALGDVDTHDGPCRRIANLAPCTVISLDYRKSPEHPFPAAVNDTDAVIDWIMHEGAAKGLTPEHLVIAGVSAGATLAAVGARRARDRGITLGGQALVVPATQLATDTPSYDRFADGFNLTAAKMRWFIEQTFSPEDRTNPDAAPLLAEDLSRLPPALVLTAAFDPLRDDGRAYAARLIEAGNDVTYVEVPGTIHGTWNMNAVTPATRHFVDRTALWAAGIWRNARTADG